MAFVQKSDYSVNDYKAKYQDISVLYDYADELISVVEDVATENPQAHLSLLEPLVNEIADSTDILTEEFILVAESKKPRASSRFSKKRIENALRRVWVAVGDYNESAKSFVGQNGGKLAVAVVKIVEKIQAQLDRVVEIFLELINISLQSIMGKTEMDSLRQRNSRIAIMMHQISLSQHGG